MADAPARREKFSVLGSWPGRALVLGVAVRIADFLAGVALGRVPSVIGVIDTVAAIVIALAAVYFLARSLAVLKRHLLWRLRHKLIISYAFIGLVPAILLLAFFLIGGVLLFLNFSAYLTRTEFRELGARAEGAARTAAAEIERAGGRDVAGILARRQTAVSQEFPGVSLALLRLDRPCAADHRTSPERDQPATLGIAGPWAHAAPPDQIPDWIDCGGFRGLLAASATGEGLGSRPAIGGERGALVTAPGDTQLVVRAVGFPPSSRPGYAVVVDLVVNAPMKHLIRDTIGVAFIGVSDVSKNVPLLRARPAAAAAGPTAEEALPPLPSLAILEYRDWGTGQSGTLNTTIRLSIGELYDRISAAPGDSTSNIVVILLEIVGGLFLIIEFFALAFGVALARSITGSVHELFAGTERVRQGDFTHKIAVTAPDQLGELAGSFNSMTASIEDLLIQAAEKKRLEEELRIAHEIQMSLLPQGPLSAPGVSLSALCVPAREVGGDYYDVLHLPDGRIGLLIADVSGKGTSAALYMAELKGLMLSLSKIYMSPRELLIQANRLIAEHLDSRSFITMTYAVIDRAAGTMTHARAGHTPLIYVPGPGGGPRVAQILVPDGLVLGLKIDNGERFEALLQEETTRLSVGDVLLFFTDGITEAMNDADDYFGDERLGQLIEEHADLPAEEIRERVLREITAFVGAAPQHDDMTMILLKIEASSGAAAGVTG